MTSAHSSSPCGHTPHLPLDQEPYPTQLSHYPVFAGYILVTSHNVDPTYELPDAYQPIEPGWQSTSTARFLLGERRGRDEEDAVVQSYGEGRS